MKHSTFFLAGLLLLVSACTPKPAPVKVTVYFTNLSRYAVGTEPYEDSVTRTVPLTASLPGAVLTQLFLGPTSQEKTQGLELVLSGTTGYKKLTITDGVARVYLTGKCNSRGSTYTIGNLIAANMAQFPEVKWVKIYDENGETETPDGQSGSIPLCLEP
jgi:Sporulation and spore germination